MSNTKKSNDPEKGLLIHVVTRSSESQDVTHSVIEIPASEKLVPDNETKLARYIKDIRRDAMMEGWIESAQVSILRVITKRFGAEVAQGIALEIEGIVDMDKLNLILDEAVTVPSVDELRK